jgi:hypothetical protein
LLLRLLLRRGLVLWVGARLVLWVGARLMAALVVRLPPPVVPQPSTWHLGAAATPWFLLLLMLVFWLDLRRRRELVLISNLGLPPTFAAMLGCLPGFAGEIAIASFLP